MSQQFAVDLLMCGLASMIRADFACPPSEAARCLCESAICLGELGTGDPEQLNLLAFNWAATPAIPQSTEHDRQRVNEQIAELVPGWFS